MTTFSEYQAFVDRLRHKDGKPMPPTGVALGLLGEAGEVADLVKKSGWHGKELNRDELLLELGDVAWYATAAALIVGRPVWCAEDPCCLETLAETAINLALDAAALASATDDCRERAVDAEVGAVFCAIRWTAEKIGFSLEDVLRANIEKLSKRYPNGFVEGGGVR